MREGSTGLTRIRYGFVSRNTYLLFISDMFIQTCSPFLASSVVLGSASVRSSSLAGFRGLDFSLAATHHAAEQAAGPEKIDALDKSPQSKSHQLSKKFGGTTS